MSDEKGALDLTLLGNAGRGDRGAFDRLVARHRSALLAMLSGILRGNRPVAEDALQDALLSAWGAAASFRGDASVRTWLATLCRHAAIRRMRRRSGEPAAHESLEVLALAAGWGDASFDPERAASLAEDRDRLLTALGSLSDDDREVIALRDLAELSGPEAAAALGLPLATMKTRLLRARLRLLGALRGTAGNAPGGDA
jgi:RNA polymerase sigma-70 factor (ECF subfamily)